MWIMADLITLTQCRVDVFWLIFHWQFYDEVTTCQLLRHWTNWTLLEVKHFRMSLLNLRQFSDIVGKFRNFFLGTFDWPTAQVQTIFKGHRNLLILCYLYNIKDIEIIIQRNVSYFRTHPHTCIIPYLFSLADQVTTDGAVTHENVPHHIVFTLFTADHVQHHSRKQIKSGFQSRQSEFFIFNN